MNLLDGLNEQQRLAVQAGEGPILILAGAGSGKTRVLTHRIAHLIFEHGVDPSAIFAVTFTNKAAAEMRHRVHDLVSRIQPGFLRSARDLWVSTFHSACVRILRSDIQHLGFSNPFTIYDDSDQLSLIKACLRDLNISDNAFSPKSIQGKINKLKNDGIDCASYHPEMGGFYEETFIRVFERYTESLRVASALDFADLILTTVKLFQKHPKVLAAYQERFPYVLVDEYQDTNRCQYLLMKLLAGPKANLCAVGDEDQSIYRWRGADITNILNFENDYPNAQIFKLEENYRSTSNIIEAASHVIAHNTERRDKKLWTQNPEGEKITLLECYDEHDEAQKVANEVVARLSQNFPLGQIAVFYRTNAQSRVLEDLFRGKGINYQIYGGLKFYSRLEVKDTLAYLRLLVNADDDVSLRRVINVPARGIGEVSVNRLSQQASERGISLYSLIRDAFESGDTTIELGRSRKNLKKFFDTVELLRRSKDNLLPSDLVNLVLEETGYRKSLIDENTSESMDRLQNLAELRQSVVEWELRSGSENPDRKIALEPFLEEIALVSDIDKFDPDAPSLRMMTIHMAKGLEFDLVFVVGLEEELFPSVRPWEEEQPSNVEEERRLFYVGMTRARRKLFLLFAKNRTVFGTAHFRVRSRFIDEVPEEYLEEKKADYFSRRRSFLDRPSAAAPLDSSYEEGFSQVYSDADEFSQTAGEDEGHSLRLGAQVTHPTFGNGIVRKKLDGDKIIVEFAGRGPKKISSRFVSLRENE